MIGAFKNAPKVLVARLRLEFSYFCKIIINVFEIKANIFVANCDQIGQIFYEKTKIKMKETGVVSRLKIFEKWEKN